MIEDLHRPARPQGSGREATEGPTSNFSTLLEKARTPIYDGASFSVLWAAMEIMNLETSFGWSNASVDALLSLMGKMLPQPHQTSSYTRRGKEADDHIAWAQLRQNPCMYQRLCVVPR
jgi:hypothetical protein